MANALWLPSRAARSLLPLLAAASLAQAPVRVAYLHQGLPVGGVESSLINVCRFIDRRRIEPVLVLFGRDAADALLDDALRAGCAVERFDARWRNADWSISWDERQVRRLTRYLRSGGFGAAVAFYGGAELGEAVPLGVAAANRAGLPVVVRIEWVAAAPPDLDVAAVEVSTPFVARIQTRKGVAYPLHLLGGGVEVPATYARTPGASRTLVVGRISRLIVEKDPISFVLAAPLIRDALVGSTYDAVRFLIAGDGPLRGELEALDADQGGLVEFLGAVPRSGLWAFLDSIDVFLYSSVCDSLGYVMLEAMAAARPVVATRVCAAEDVVDDGVTGVLVDPVLDERGEHSLGDASAKRHADAVVALVRRGPAALEAAGAAARAVVERAWAAPKFFDRHASLLESVAQKTQTVDALPYERRRWSKVTATWALTKFIYAEETGDGGFQNEVMGCVETKSSTRLQFERIRMF